MWRWRAAAHDTGTERERGVEEAGVAGRWGGREDGAICRTKPDRPEATSGPAVTPATERGMRGERKKTRLELSWLCHCYCLRPATTSARWVGTKRSTKQQLKHAHGTRFTCSLFLFLFLTRLETVSIEKRHLPHREQVESDQSVTKQKLMIWRQATRRHNRFCPLRAYQLQQREKGAGGLRLLSINISFI